MDTAGDFSISQADFSCAALTAGAGFFTSMPYWDLLIKHCGCCTRNPTAKGFASIRNCFSYNMDSVSLALCPIASTSTSVSSHLEPLISTAVIRGESAGLFNIPEYLISVMRLSKYTSPPRESISIRMFFTIFFNTSVPR